ncbi:MAG: NAD-dependent protein deacylase, partial [Oscillospiraceae bacterium]|nr:NAD-dependent protein deacylase [Oscillospiraceae bacterium]
MTTEISKLTEILRAGNAVFFGGAGVSTESGIPDFRSEKGLYSAKQIYGYSPEELISHTFLVKKPEIFYKYYRENLVSLSAKPNPAHLALAELENRGLLQAVITQNIDGLHQAAGSREVL